MKYKLQKVSLLLIPVALGIFFIWYSFSTLSESDIQSIIQSFKTANYWWVCLSLVFGIISHIIRAYRWQFLLEPLGYTPKLANSIMTVLVAYLFNLFVPRSGEVARAAGIHKYEKIPFEKAFGTIVAERVADVIILLVIIGLAFFLQSDLISSYLFKDKTQGNTYLYLLILVILPLIVILAYQRCKRSAHPYIVKIVTFVKGLIKGVMSIVTMKKKWWFIMHSLLIWIFYILMFYVTTFALPETTGLPFGAIIVGFVVGGLSIALTNGGLGSYPLLVSSALVLYNIDNNPAIAFGWIMWTAQTAMIIVFGCLSLVALPLYNKLRTRPFSQV